MKINIRLLIVALVLGLATVVALSFYLNRLSEPAMDSDPRVDVVIAARTIAAHSRITADMLELSAVPAESAHPDAMKQVANALGGIARSEIIQGEQVLAARVFTEERRATLSYRIPENMRAVSIPVNEVTGVGGYISAGDRVDVLVTYQNNDDISNKTVTYTVFQNIFVLAVGDSPREKDDQERQVVSTVTLSVTPAQAEVVAFAYLEGSFHLTLRSPTDEYRADLDHYSPDNFDTFRRR